MAFEDALRNVTDVLAMTFNPEVAMQQKQMEYKKRQDAIGQLQEGIQSGAIDPVVGNQRLQQLGGQAVGPNQLTLDRQEALRQKQQQDALNAQIRPQLQQIAADPNLTPQQKQQKAFELYSELDPQSALKAAAVPPASLQQTTEGIQQFQRGVFGPTVTPTGAKAPPRAAGGAGGWQNVEPTPDELEGSMYAYLIKNNPPPRGSKLYERTMGAIAKLARDNNMSTKDIMAASADVKSQLLAKTQLEKRIQNTERAETLIEKEIPVLERAMKLVDAPDSPWPARLSMAAVRQGAGSKEQRAAVAQLDQSAQAILNEFQGVVAGNPGGALHVSDVEQARNEYLKLSAPTEMRAWISNAQNMIKRAKEAGKETRRAVMSGVTEAIPGGKKPATKSVHWDELK